MSVERRVAIRNEIQIAIAHGVTHQDVTEVLTALRAERRPVDIDELRGALAQYIPAEAFHADLPSYRSYMELLAA